jgi:peptidoglycan/xylan/chitin deacetylase (PgdA/CDA1 family)
MQYAQTLPLNDHEVVITFDDGPIPPYTNVVLDTLASQCVKATYFLVGEMARAHPSLVRRIYNAGHTIGTHSQNHPYAFQRLSTQSAERQVDGGIESVDAALGDPKALSPFFRIPGLGRTNAIENYLESRSLVTWSADVVADDWKHIGAREIVRRAMRRLEEKGRGILLLHDIHPATALAVPILLKELKDRGYRVVQVVAAGERPDQLPELSDAPEHKEGWPRVVKTSAGEDAPARLAMRHRVKKIAGGKRRQPGVAGHEPNAADGDWRQSQFY